MAAQSKTKYGKQSRQTETTYCIMIYVKIAIFNPAFYPL